MKTKTPKDVLNEIFKLPDFRGEQEAIILRTLAGGSSLIIMPTGMGKSLCFQLPSRLLGGLTLVISPLIALMKDQVDAAQKLGLKSTFINSSLDRDERERRYKKLANREYELLYVTPERFRKPEFKDSVSKNTVSLLAIDEAHCISEWGHDFRPDYTKIKEFRAFLKNPPTQMLTATATAEVQADIIKQVGLKDAEVKAFVAGIQRPNLYVEMDDLYGWEQKANGFLRWSEKISGPKIVYFSLVSSLEKFAEVLHAKKISFFSYHGQLSARDRRKNQEEFLASEQGLILATPAFGLGVNKPNIRGVAHMELPGSIESYYQEIGRAGRDGEPASTVMFYDEEDITIQMDFIKWTNPEPNFLLRCYRLIEKNPDKVRSGGLDYLREQLNFYNKRDFRVETAVNLLEHWGFVEYEEKGKGIRALEEPAGEMLDEQLAAARLKGQNMKLLEMVKLVKSETCRKKTIYEYFGVAAGDCGNCDNCL
jgi:ATP-dependent DNA helicase RecQ